MEGILILSSRRRGAPGFGGSTELPGSWGLMMSGAGGGGGVGGDWDSGSLDCSATAIKTEYRCYYSGLCYL